MSRLYREAEPAAPVSERAGSLSNKKRRNVTSAAAGEKAKNSDFIGYYDNLRNHSGTSIAPFCSNVTGHNDSHHVSLLYYSTVNEEESYRLLHVGVFLPFSTIEQSVHDEAFYSDATSAMLAAPHFNTASDDVLCEIRSPSCDVRLTLEFFDTQEWPIVSGRILKSGFIKKEQDCSSITPDVILGPRRSAVAVSTAVLANLHGIPVISHGAYLFTT
jgi:hypothetical protein